ncbi:MAG: RDD family protein [Victivallales bacterium]|nr:RDD family protein [Victivallales bacterium]
MANTRLYFLKNEAGEQIGPLDEEALVRLAQEGKVTLNCQVRPTLLPTWNKALDVPFLKPILKQELARQVEQQHNTPWTRLKARLTLRAPESSDSFGLTKKDANNYPAASLGLRLAAGLTDVLILAVWALLLFLGFAWLFSRQLISPDAVFYIGFTIWWLSVLFYYTLGMSWMAQTPGQRFWGIFLLRRDNLKFWCGRTFFYTLFLLLSGIFTPLFVLTTGCSLAELITGTRMVRIIFQDEGKISS